MRFQEYLNENFLLIESVNKERYERYFKNQGNVDLYVKTKSVRGAKLYNKDLEQLNIYAEDGEKITLLNFKAISGKIGTQKKKHYFVPVQYGNRVVYIDVNYIRTPGQARGESLGIQATNLIQSANNASEPVMMWGKKYASSEFKEFTTHIELANSIIQGFNNNNKVPDYVASEMERILNSGSYSDFDWGLIKSESYKNQIGKYYGELLVGLCLLNGEYGAFQGELQGMLGGQKIVSFLMPISPSFPAADSVVKTDKKYIPISSKKGGGTGASFFANVVPRLGETPDGELKSPSNILLQLKDIYKEVNNPREVITQIYLWGFRTLLKDVKIKKRPSEIYKTILQKDFPDEDVDKVANYIKDKKWKNIKSSHLKSVKDNLPFSLTHFFLYHLNYILSKDIRAQDIILDLLGAKEYWQVDLQDNPWVNGNAVFKLKKSDKTELTFSPTRGKINDIKSSHAKLNYILK